ncbi:MAG: hypothetical protein ACR2HP_17695 [Ilumatobacteraceae bacterium]
MSRPARNGRLDSSTPDSQPPASVPNRSRRRLARRLDQFVVGNLHLLCERFIIERRTPAEEVIVLFDIDRITDLDDFEPGQLRTRVEELDGRDEPLSTDRISMGAGVPDCIERIMETPLQVQEAALGATGKGLL